MSQASNLPGPKVALVCTGLGRHLRGYEASVLELYQQLKSNGNYRLYAGRAGVAEGAIGLANIPRQSNSYRHIPVEVLSSGSRYTIECYSAAISLMGFLIKDPVDVIFTPDHKLGDFLLRGRYFLPNRPRIIFSNGAPFDSAYGLKYDAIHQKSYVDYYDGVSRFGSDLQSYLVPNGFDSGRLQMPAGFDRSAMRGRLGVKPDRHVVLSLAALQLTHKRLDWLISEFSRLPPDGFHLIMAGAETDETNAVRQLAHSALPQGNFTITTLPYEEVPALVWSSDMLALCSLSEGFPRVVAEAMGAARYIAVHPHPNNRWILENSSCYVDMEVPGALAARIRDHGTNPGGFDPAVIANLVRFNASFRWEVVLQKYVEMFQQVGGVDPGAGF